MAMRLARQWRVGSSQKRQDLITAYLCLLPWMVGFLSFVFGPMLFSLGLSFFRSDLLTSTFFVGLENYRDLFNEDSLLEEPARNLYLRLLNRAARLLPCPHDRPRLEPEAAGARHLAHYLLPAHRHLRRRRFSAMAPDL